MFRGNILVVYLVIILLDEEEEFIVKREREGVKNEVFLNFKIFIKRKNRLY